jgi:hypothetical protein
VELQGGPRDPILDPRIEDDDEDVDLASLTDEPVAPPGGQEVRPLVAVVGPTVWSRLRHPEV